MAAFIPLVPLASMGRMGLLSQMSTPLVIAITGMCLTCEYELNLASSKCPQTLKIAENKVRTLVCCKPPCETDCQSFLMEFHAGRNSDKVTED